MEQTVADKILADQEVQSLFDQLEKATGKQFTPKARLIAVRKEENRENPLEEVKKILNAKIKEAAASANEQTPPTNADGIM